MERRLTIVTLGVADVDRAKAFYDALGWAGQEVEATVFYQAGPLAVVLWSRAKLAADAGIDDTGTDGFGGVALAQNVRSREEVDEVLAAAVAAGARLTSPASDTFYGGYAGYFADPDGHLWEIAYNPGFALGPDGALTLGDLSG
jgi:predicted lactoylglutathione lyase